mmetsp:Transcript_6893/g.42061  ORF Transcript_6893/g.42061 Transcript_6893/m.42061 type:complete len:338 (+) Transcript_6893:1882-2895(+)
MGRVLCRPVQPVDAILHLEIAELCLVAPVLVDGQHGPWDVEARLLHVCERRDDECIGQFVVAFAFDPPIQFGQRLSSIGLDFTHVLLHAECRFDAHVFPPRIRFFGLACSGEFPGRQRREHDPPGELAFVPLRLGGSSGFDRTTTGGTALAACFGHLVVAFRPLRASHQSKDRSRSAPMAANRSANGPGSATSASHAAAMPTDTTRLSGSVSKVSTRRPFHVNKKTSKGRRTVCHVPGGGSKTACHKSGGAPGGAIQLSVRKLAMYRRPSPNTRKVTTLQASMGKYPELGGKLRMPQNPLRVRRLFSSTSNRRWPWKRASPPPLPSVHSHATWLRPP